MKQLLSAFSESNFHLVRISEERFTQALELRSKFLDKPLISFTDLTSMVVMQEFSIIKLINLFENRSMAYKLLFVCLGNICRSPSAENIMNYLIEKSNLSDRIICDSAGTSSYHIGSPPDRRMSAAAAKRGIKLLGRARELEIADFKDFDLILAMDRENYRDILYLDRQNQYSNKVKLICDFASHHQEKEVPDPYYGGPEGFDRVINLLLDACNGLLEEIVREQNWPRES